MGCPRQVSLNPVKEVIEEKTHHGKLLLEEPTKMGEKALLEVFFHFSSSSSSSFRLILLYPRFRIPSAFFPSECSSRIRIRNIGLERSQLLLLLLFSFGSLVLDLFFLPRSTSQPLLHSLSLSFNLRSSLFFFLYRSPSHSFFSSLDLPISPVFSHSRLVLSSSSDHSQCILSSYCILFLPHTSILISSPPSDSSPLLPSQNFDPFFIDHRLSRYPLPLCQSLLFQPSIVSRSFSLTL